MKKICLISFFLIFIVFSAFGETEDQTEIDHLLFMPDSGSRFVNEAQAMTQLDNIARYLSGRNLTSGQVYVYGYAAFAVNDIDPLDLSKDRALFIINELQRRGVPRNVFSDPIGRGSVDLWGGNTDEVDRSPNRRVRVVLDGSVLTPETLKDSEPEIVISNIDDEEPFSYTEEKTEKMEKPASEFPWRLLLLLLAMIAAFIYLLYRREKSRPAKPAKPVRPQPVKLKPAAAPVVITKRTVNLDEEIRLRAYELYLERGSLDGHASGDWYGALIDVSARYEAAGYQVYFEGEYWWASLQEIKPAQNRNTL